MFYAAPCQQYQSSGHRDHITDHIATTRGYTETTRVPVKTGQCHPRTTVAAPILLQASANPCKTLQSASICFETAMQENAIFCNRMLRNASFCFAHTCASPPKKWARSPSRWCPVVNSRRPIPRFISLLMSQRICVCASCDRTRHRWRRSPRVPRRWRDCNK